MIFFTLFFILVTVLGLSIRKISVWTKTSEKILTILLYPCLFLVGILLGVDDKVVLTIESIGWQTFFYIIATLVLVFSLLWVIQRLLFR